MSITCMSPSFTFLPGLISNPKHLETQQKHYTVMHYINSTTLKIIPILHWKTDLSIFSSRPWPVCCTVIIIRFSTLHLSLKTFLSFGHKVKLPLESSSLNSNETVNRNTLLSEMKRESDIALGDFGIRRKAVAKQYNSLATYCKLTHQNTNIIKKGDKIHHKIKPVNKSTLRLTNRTTMIIGRIVVATLQWN